MKPKKKLLRTVKLRFFQDDANGEWGLTHADTIQSDNGFNAFWDGQGIFHDVFEHAHEHADKHFRGLAAMNVGGEVAAMGSLWYFYEDCNFHARLRSIYHNPDRMTVDTTLTMMQEAIEEGHASFGDTLESAVPKQKPVETSNGLEYLIEDHCERVAKYIAGGDNEDADTKERGAYYKQSVTPEKIADLYRYGYRMAEKMFPNPGYRLGSMMEDFTTFWTTFCKQNPAEQMAQMFRNLTFKIYRDADGLLAWTAILEPQAGIPSDEVSRVILKGGQDGVPEYVPHLGY